MGHPRALGIVYEIGFSFFHCVVVRIDMDDQGSFKHTPPLQFLPSFHAESLSTPGITALVRLGYMSEPLDRLGIQPGEPPRDCLLDDIPLELWSKIAQYLFSVDDVIALGSISARSWAVANNILRYPHLGSRYLIGLKSSMPLDKPAYFEAAGEFPRFYIQLGRDRFEPQAQGNLNDETILDEGHICFQCEREDSTCICTSSPYVNARRDVYHTLFVVTCENILADYAAVVLNIGMMAD